MNKCAGISSIKYNISTCLFKTVIRINNQHVNVAYCTFLRPDEDRMKGQNNKNMTVKHDNTNYPKWTLARALTVQVRFHCENRTMEMFFPLKLDICAFTNHFLKVLSCTKYTYFVSSIFSKCILESFNFVLNDP